MSRTRFGYYFAALLCRLGLHARARLYPHPIGVHWYVICTRDACHLRGERIGRGRNDV